MTIRKATVADADSLYILNQLFGNTTTVDDIKQSLIENHCEIVSIAFVDNKPVAFCSGIIIQSFCYRSPRMDIEALYVRDEFRKQGVGRALLRCLEKEARILGIHHFHILTHALNVSGQALYEKCGYAKTGEVLFEKTVVE